MALWRFPLCPCSCGIPHGMARSTLCRSTMDKRVGISTRSFPLRWNIMIIDDVSDVHLTKALVDVLMETIGSKSARSLQLEPSKRYLRCSKALHDHTCLCMPGPRIWRYLGKSSERQHAKIVLRSAPTYHRRDPLRLYCNFMRKCRGRIIRYITASKPCRGQLPF